jgi:hypothetical protein
MPDRPQHGDRFVVAGRRDYLTVAECHLAATDDVSGVTRYLVTASAGSRWSLVARPIADGVRWIGTALPADPKAPAP